MIRTGTQHRVLVAVDAYFSNRGRPVDDESHSITMIAMRHSRSSSYGWPGGPLCLVRFSDVQLPPQILCQDFDIRRVFDRLTLPALTKHLCVPLCLAPMLLPLSVLVLSIFSCFSAVLVDYTSFLTADGAISKLLNFCRSFSKQSASSVSSKEEHVASVSHAVGFIRSLGNRRIVSTLQLRWCGKGQNV